MYLLENLNSNIEIHKSSNSSKDLAFIVYLNSNIEIHKLTMRNL